MAGLLTRMMGPKVLHVPSLGKIPAALLANVYVFTNGVKGDGPMGFQPDVFDAVPGDPRYTPLRALNLVTWRSGAPARVLGGGSPARQSGGRGTPRARSVARFHVNQHVHSRQGLYQVLLEVIRHIVGLADREGAVQHQMQVEEPAGSGLPRAHRMVFDDVAAMSIEDR